MGRAYVNRQVQVGVEVTKGTAVPTTKTLPTMSIELTRELTVKQYRQLGQKGVAASKINQDWCSGKLSGPLNFTELVYALSMLVSPVITTPGGGTLSRQWLFTALNQGADAFKTLTIQEGDSTAAQQAAFCLLTQFGITIAKDDATIAGTILGQNLAAASLTTTINEIQSFIKTGTVSGGSSAWTYSGQTTGAIPYNATADDVYGALVALSNIGANDVIVTGGPLPSTAVRVEFTGALAGTNVASITVDNTNITGGGTIVQSTVNNGGAGTISSPALLPIGPRQVDIYMDAIGGTIGTTAVTDALTAAFGIANKQVPKWVLSTSNSSWKESVEVPPAMTGEILTEHNSQSRAFYAAISSTDNPYYLIRFKFTGPLIEGSIYYTLTVDFAAQVIAMAQTDSDGVWAYKYTLLPSFNATYGNKLWEMALVNQLTSL